MSWNASYTRRKQEEMTEKSISKSQNKPSWAEPQPNVSTSTFERKLMQDRHDRLCWRIGYCIIGIITGLFVWLFIGIV